MLLALTPLLLFAGCAPDVPPSRAAAVYGGDTARPTVTLTFDLNGDYVKTVQVLDILAANHISAAFAVNGQFASNFPSVVQRIARDGHQIMNHTWNHPDVRYLSRPQLYDQLDSTERQLNGLGLTSAGWFRPPYGGRSAAVDDSLAAHGYYLDVLWNVDSNGWRGWPVSSVVSTVLNEVRPGSIILMHPNPTSTDPAALPEVIRQLRARGYGFTTLAQTMTYGLIGAHYAQLGGMRSVLGVPRTVELGLPDGRWQLFRSGRMYWSGPSGAWSVHGAILDEYQRLDSTAGLLGYPTTDESPTGNRQGRYNHFRRGSVFWSRSTGAHEVHGRIRATWASMGAEAGPLGFPTSDEYSYANGRRSDFQHGHLYWHADTNVVDVVLTSV